MHHFSTHATFREEDTASDFHYSDDEDRITAPASVAPEPIAPASQAQDQAKADNASISGQVDALV
jgi:hypothetical protein